MIVKLHPAFIISEKRLIKSKVIALISFNRKRNLIRLGKMYLFGLWAAMDSAGVLLFEILDRTVGVSAGDWPKTGGRRR